MIPHRDHCYHIYIVNDIDSGIYKSIEPARVFGPKIQRPWHSHDTIGQNPPKQPFSPVAIISQ